MNIKCTKCKETKDSAFFHKDKSKKNGFICVCKECKKIREHLYYIKNTEKCKANASSHRIKRAEWWRKYKSQFKCIDCGFSDARALDFHHTDPKEKIQCVSTLVRAKDDILFEEIKKCIVLCANCHRIRHG